MHRSSLICEISTLDLRLSIHKLSLFAPAEFYQSVLLIIFYDDKN